MRGINVGGNAKVSMDILKQSLVAQKYSNVKTYINSGNLLVCTPQDKKTLRENIDEIIKKNFGLSVEMIVKTKAEIDHIINNDPFDKENETDNSKKVVMMLSEEIEPEKTAIFNTDSKIIEKFYVNGDLLYVYYHNGAGQSKFTINYVEKKLKVASTARNWNTMLKMAEMSDVI